MHRQRLMEGDTIRTQPITISEEGRNPSNPRNATQRNATQRNATQHTTAPYNRYQQHRNQPSVLSTVTEHRDRTPNPAICCLLTLRLYPHLTSLLLR